MKCSSHLISTDSSNLDVEICWNKDSFSKVKLSWFSAATGFDVDSASDLYNFTLSRILDKMIFFKTVRVQERPSDTLFDQECRT